jgi:hypothetical protein
MSIARTLRALVSDLDSDMAAVRAKTLGSIASGGTLARPKPGEVRVFAATVDDETDPPDARAVEQAGRLRTTRPRA